MAAFPIDDCVLSHPHKPPGFPKRQPKLHPAFPHVLADSLRVLGITLWFLALKLDQDEWQKGNAAMRIHRVFTIN